MGDGGHKVRIAMVGWGGVRAAESLDEVKAGVRVPWVEIDGHRYPQVVGAELSIDQDSFLIPRITLDVIGPVELVYLAADGTELGAVPVAVGDPDPDDPKPHIAEVAGQPLDADAFVPRPDGTHFETPAERTETVADITIADDPDEAAITVNVKFTEPTFDVEGMSDKIVEAIHDAIRARRPTT